MAGLPWLEPRAYAEMVTTSWQQRHPSTYSIPWDAGCDRDMRALQPQLFLPFDPARIL
ncbi:MAG TPA: hypothetical protein VF474_03640 [Phenylobacterium sp.]